MCSLLGPKFPMCVSLSRSKRNLRLCTSYLSLRIWTLGQWMQSPPKKTLDENHKEKQVELKTQKEHITLKSRRETQTQWANWTLNGGRHRIFLTHHWTGWSCKRQMPTTIHPSNYVEVVLPFFECIWGSRSSREWGWWWWMPANSSCFRFFHVIGHKISFHRFDGETGKSTSILNFNSRVTTKASS